MKKSFSIVLTLIMLTLLLTLSSSCSHKLTEDIWINKVTVDAAIKPDGSLVVNERWDVEANNETGKINLYKVLSLTSDDEKFGNIHSSIDEFSVFDNTNNRPLNDLGTGSFEKFRATGELGFYIDNRITDSVEIGLMMPPFKSGKRSYTFQYTLKGFLAKFNDCVVMYWKQFDSSSFSLYIEEYEANIHLPVNAAKNSMHWFHTEVPGSFSELKEDGNTIHYVASDITIGTNIETRILFDDVEKFPTVVLCSPTDMKKLL